MKAFLPAMIERNEGHLVSIASGAGLMSGNGFADYCSSKFAAVGKFLFLLFVYIFNSPSKSAS